MGLIQRYLRKRQTLDQSYAQVGLLLEALLNHRALTPYEVFLGEFLWLHEPPSIKAFEF